MNKVRRAALQKVVEALDAAKSDLETLRDEEQEYFDNMPENMQGGEKGSNAENAVSEMEEGIQAIEEAMEQIDTAIGHVEGAIEG